MRLLWRRRFANEPDHELIWFAVSVGFIAGGGLLALVLSLAEMCCFPRGDRFALRNLRCHSLDDCAPAWNFLLAL